VVVLGQCQQEHEEIKKEGFVRHEDLPCSYSSLSPDELSRDYTVGKAWVSDAVLEETPTERLPKRCGRLL